MYGQGDCTIIRTKYNKAILIDSGEGNSEKYDYGKSVVLPYLLAHHISKIDYLILSHFDSDHAGGAFYILENLKVENIVIGVQAEKYDNCVEFIKIAQEKNINIIVLKLNDVLQVDKETYFEVLFPDIKNTISENKINNNSLVLKLVYKKFSMLFTGDIEELGERAILKNKENSLKATVIKIAHHGSKSSSIEEFISKVSPKIAVIGVGSRNNFGHPNQEVLERLREHKVQIFRTDENGETSILTDGYKIICNTNY